MTMKLLHMICLMVSILYAMGDLPARLLNIKLEEKYQSSTEHNSNTIKAVILFYNIFSFNSYYCIFSNKILLHFGQAGSIQSA
jgi:hypothetical protein